MTKTMQDWIFAHEAMRRLGFAPGELFFAVSPLAFPLRGAISIVSLVARRGSKEFVWNVGYSDLNFDQLQEEHRLAVAEWAAGVDSAENLAAFQQFMDGNGVELCVTLQMKGMLPTLQRNEDAEN